jgi:hypothetical protein
LQFAPVKICATKGCTQHAKVFKICTSRLCTAQSNSRKQRGKDTKLLVGPSEQTYKLGALDYFEWTEVNRSFCQKEFQIVEQKQTAIK